MTTGVGRRGLWIGALLLARLAVGFYLHFDLGSLLTLDSLKSSRDSLLGLYRREPALTLASFLALYVGSVALSIPGATILTLAAGALFGVAVGVAVVSFAASLGALLAFLIARYLLRDLVRERFGKRLAPIDAGMRRDGAFYLLTLRLLPAFPFFLVNLLSALTPIGAWRFYWVTQLGSLPATVVYVNAGTQLASIHSPADILSPALWLSFALLAALPWLGRGVVGGWRTRQVYAGWPRPKRFDRNLVVIGAGAGGLVTAYVAAAVKARVTLVEAHRMGGDCLNFGCVPSKALIRSARLAKEVRDGAALGVTSPGARVDFAAAMARVQRVIATIAPHDSVERYTGLGVEVLTGRARITSPWSVEIAGVGGAEGAEGVRTLTTRSIVIAAGASPTVPPIPGLAEVGYLTSDTVWGLPSLPARLVVLGGGPVGCELAQAFARLGAKVTLVEMAPRVMLREDEDAAALVAAALEADGVTLLTGHRAIRCERDGEVRRLIAHGGEAERTIEFDQLLCAVGRSPRVEGYGLETLGVALVDKTRTIETDAWLRTRYPNIFAVGDVAGPYQLTHVAAHQAWHAAVNALFGRFKRFKVDYAVIPWATFTDPEVARVGLSEAEATAQNVAYEVTRFPLQQLDRAVTDAATQGFVKVLTPPGKDTLLGVTIVGEHAGDLLAEYVLAMKHGLGLNKVLGTVHAYPTMSEASRSVAGAWRRAHAPERLLAWVRRYHAWERG